MDTQSKKEKYQLLYFPVRGRAQAIRYLMLDNDIEFEDVYCVDQWLKGLREKMPFGQAPLLKDGDFEVAQSNAILRYLARKHGLYPSDIREAAKVDMMTDFVVEHRENYVRMIWENYEAGKDEFIKNLPSKLQFAENLFKSWGTDFITSKISFADYTLFDLLDNFLILSSTCLDPFPTLKAYHNRMASRPKLKQLRDTDAFKNMKCNGNGKQ